MQGRERMAAATLAAALMLLTGAAAAAQIRSPAELALTETPIPPPGMRGESAERKTACVPSVPLVEIMTPVEVLEALTFRLLPIMILLLAVVAVMVAFVFPIKMLFVPVNASLPLPLPINKLFVEPAPLRLLSPIEVDVFPRLCDNLPIAIESAPDVPVLVPMLMELLPAAFTVEPIPSAPDPIVVDVLIPIPLLLAAAAIFWVAPKRMLYCPVVTTPFKLFEPIAMFPCPVIKSRPQLFPINTEPSEPAPALKL